MRREVVIKRGWLLMTAVVIAVLLAGGVALREMDVSRIENRALKQNEQRIAENAKTITELRRTTEVLCERGNVLIDLVNTALVLVGQRLVADVKAGNAAAVRADRRFLTSFLQDRERLIREQTGDGPCAP